MKVLFICKKNHAYGHPGSSGLFNSTRYIVEGLNRVGLKRFTQCRGQTPHLLAKIVEVIDNNDIDREVTAFKPDKVVIEALWVVPEKFDVLRTLHPSVVWFVHLHSNIPFLATEGIALEWLRGYQDRFVDVLANSPQAFSALREMMDEDSIEFLPNVYLAPERRPKSFPEISEWVKAQAIDVGCFGAIRPMKNTLIQAMAALRFAREKGFFLRFHINAGRVEVGGESILKNLEELFLTNYLHGRLIKNKWLTSSQFRELLESEIDLGMQVSLSETFNVVSADYTASGIPMVVSKEIPWSSRLNQADTDSVDSIVKTMHRVWGRKCLVRWNQWRLKRYSLKALSHWVEWAMR